MLDALGALSNRTALSLARRPVGHDDGGGVSTLADTLGSFESGYDRAEERAALAPALRRLPAREQEILRLRFVEDLTQSEIATRIGVSQMQVSRLLRRSLELLSKLTRASSGETLH